MLVDLKTILADTREKHYAVGLFNCVTLEMTKGILAAAEELHSPVIIGPAESLLPGASLAEYADMMLSMARRAGVHVALHFDHGFTPELVEEAIRLGFSSAPERGMDRAQTILEQAQVPGADFTQMVALYNDDPYMTENIQGIVMTASQCENSPQFETVFELEEGEITGVLVGTDGYYIVKRLPLAVTYYDDNQEAILQEARDVQFNELLEEWTEEASMRTTDIYKKMDFDNLWDYVE